MAFGKKKNKETDSFNYDLDSHCDRPSYEAVEGNDSASNSISGLADHLLIAELEFRGYSVVKK